MEDFVALGDAMAVRGMTLSKALEQAVRRKRVNVGKDDSCNCCSKLYLRLVLSLSGDFSHSQRR